MQEMLEKQEKNEAADKKDKNGWVEESDYEDDADVIKLNVDESITGVLTEIKNSGVYGQLYKIKVKDDERLKIICGTTVLNRKMEKHVVGDEVMIERVVDGKNESGKAYHNYKVYHREASD